MLGGETLAELSMVVLGLDLERNQLVGEGARRVLKGEIGF
jgi:hypothetical protein